MGTKKLKIAFLSRYVGRVSRGVETYVLELSSRLAKKHDVVVLTGEDSDSIKQIIDSSFDIVIATNGRLQSLKASLARLLSKHKLIISGQAGIGKDDIWNIFIRPNVYVALTSYEYKWAKKLAWNMKLKYIPNGVDLSMFNPVGKKLEFSLQRPLILSVGALFWYKHHELSIEAVARLEVGSLLIIGSGPEEQSLNSLGKQVLGEHRFRIMQVDYADIPIYYRSADVFVLPSWIRESFGIVYLEALASGIPVVAPDDPPRREIIGKGGIFTDVYDDKQYAQAIQEALNTKWYDRTRKQAEKFSWDKIASQYEKLFKELIK